MGGNTPKRPDRLTVLLFFKRLLDKLIDWFDTKVGKVFIYGRKDLALLVSLQPSVQEAVTLISRCNLKSLF